VQVGRAAVAGREPRDHVVVVVGDHVGAPPEPAGVVPLPPRQDRLPPVGGDPEVRGALGRRPEPDRLARVVRDQQALLALDDAGRHEDESRRERAAGVPHRGHERRREIGTRPEAMDRRGRPGGRRGAAGPGEQARGAAAEDEREARAGGATDKPGPRQPQLDGRVPRRPNPLDPLIYAPSRQMNVRAT
jgi:hypothetical protein